jgi:hypothetical protein
MSKSRLSQLSDFRYPIPDPSWDDYGLWGYVIKLRSESSTLIAHLTDQEEACDKSLREVRSHLEAMSSVQLKI